MAKVIAKGNMSDNSNSAVVVASLPSNGSSIVSSNGNVLGVRYTFSGDSTARELKETLRKQLGLKGRALTNKVNEALRDSAANARVRTLGAVQAMHERGFVADFADVKSKAACIKFVKVEAAAQPKPSKAVEAAKAEAKAAAEKLAKFEAALAALGVSQEDLAKALATPAAA